jgi:predicted Zn-dependent protease
VRAVESLIGWLDRRPSVDGVAVVGWRLDVVEGQAVRAGVRDSRLGGPYEGPGVAHRLGGNVELHWSDGRLTRRGLDRAAVRSPAAELAAWRWDAVRERHERLPPLAGPTRLPAVETFDARVERAVLDGASSLLDVLASLSDGARAGGVGRVDAVARASCSQRTVATSRGFRADWRETTFSADLWADEFAGASYERRRLPDQADLTRLVDTVTHLASRLKVAGPLGASAHGAIFMPSVVEALLGRLLLPNLTGRAIRDGYSPFTRADLDAARSVLREDLDVVVDTTLPFEPATAPCSSEGVPAGRVRLIASGRIASPILDLATAADFGLPPTPVPRGRPGALLTSPQPPLGLSGALALLGDGVVVRDLPGLHTQHPRRSSYALVVPDAQAVVGGEAGGRCAVRLAGNLLDHLTRPSTRLVRIPGETGPGLLVLDGVELLAA